MRNLRVSRFQTFTLKKQGRKKYDEWHKMIIDIKYICSYQNSQMCLFNCVTRWKSKSEKFDFFFLPLAATCSGSFAAAISVLITIIIIIITTCVADEWMGGCTCKLKVNWQPTHSCELQPNVSLALLAIQCILV